MGLRYDVHLDGKIIISFIGFDLCPYCAVLSVFVRSPLHFALYERIKKNVPVIQTDMFVNVVCASLERLEKGC